LGFSNWLVIYYIFPRQLGTEVFGRRCRVLKKKLSHHHHRAINIKPLLARIQALKSTSGGALSGTQLMAFFLQRQIQPL
jgi:hypothetical protein